MMIKRLGEIASFQRGLTYSKGDEAPLSSKCVLRSNNIDLESSSLDLTEIKYLRDDFIIPKDRKLKANSIFICMSNGSKQHVGKVAFIDKDMDYAFGGFMGLIVPSSEVSAKYVFYACQSSAYRSFLSQVGNGIGITNLRFSDLEKFEIPVPSLSEQQRIVDELDLLSGIIEKKNAQLRTLDELASTIFYEMFGDLITNERGWNTVALKDVCGINPSKKEVSARLSEQANVSFLPMEDLPIHAGYISVKQIRTLKEVAGSYTYFADNDVLLAKVTPCFENGKVGIAHNMDNGVGFGSSEFFVFRPSEKVSKETLYFLVQTNTFISEASKQLTGTSGLRRVPRMFLENLQIGLPPIAEQLSFSNKFKHIFDERAKIASSISSSEELLSSRLDKYFNT